MQQSEVAVGVDLVYCTQMAACRSSAHAESNIWMQLGKGHSALMEQAALTRGQDLMMINFG